MNEEARGTGAWRTCRSLQNRGDFFAFARFLSMRIAISQDDQSSEEGGLTPQPQRSSQLEEKTTSQVREMNTTSKARLQAIKDRVASHTPYTANRSRRRGMDGVQNGTGRRNVQEEEDHALVLPEVFHSPAGSSFASKLLSVATTPLRAAWGIVASQLRTPSASPLGAEAGEDVGPATAGELGGNVGVGPDRLNNNDSVLAQDKGLVGSPSLPKSPTRAMEANDVEGESPSRRLTRQPQGSAGAQGLANIGGSSIPVKNAANGARTPFDGVLDMLKEGPMAGGTPARHPPPSRSTLKGMPQSMRAPRSAQPAFTFDATKQRLLSSVPAKATSVENPAWPGRLSHEGGTPAQAKQRMLFGSQRGSAMKDMPLAWTPLRATPGARATGGLRTRFAPTSRFAPASQGPSGVADAGGVSSRKRRADDINGMNPSLDDGSVSLLDMQRRRRFKPSEDLGSVQRRSWRAGRTPYSHMARYRRRIDDDDARIQDASRANAGATPAIKGGDAGRVAAESPSSARATTDTARRILDTLDSMEEKIRKSKEHISPVDARLYTLEAKAPPPPGASLGGMISSKLDSTMPPPSSMSHGATMMANGADGAPKVTSGTSFTPGATKPFLSVQEATPVPPSTSSFPNAGSWKAADEAKKMFGVSPLSSSDRPSGSKKKRTRAVEDAEEGKSGQATTENKTQKAITTTATAPATTDKPAMAPERLDVPSQPLASAPVCAVLEAPAPVKTTQAEFSFGQKECPTKQEAQKSLLGITPGTDSTKFLFGKEKQAASESTHETLVNNRAKESASEKTAVVPVFSFGGAAVNKDNAVDTAVTVVDTNPKPSFTFGAATTTAAPPVFGAPSNTSDPAPEKVVALEKKDASPEKTSDAPSGWGADFLKKNAAAASAATAAVEKEVNKEPGASPSPSPAPVFKFGAPAADLNELKPAAPAAAEVASSKPAFQFGSAVGAVPIAPTAGFSFGASDASKKDEPSEKLAGKSATENKADNAPVPVSSSGQAFAFAPSAPPSISTQTNTTDLDAPAVPKPSFTFGAATTTAAPPVFGAPSNTSDPAPEKVVALEKKDASPEKTSDAPSGWGADFLKKNAAAASAATAAVEKEVNKEPGAAPSPSPAPVFKFGAPAADLNELKPAAPAAAEVASSKPAFQFGSAASTMPEVGSDKSGLKSHTASTLPASAPASTGFTFGASSSLETKGPTGGFGASFGSTALGATAPLAAGTSSVPASGNTSSAPTFGFGADQKASTSGFAFGNQPASTPAFGTPAPSSSSAPSSFGTSGGGFGMPAPSSNSNPATNTFGAPGGGFGAPNAAPNPFGAPTGGFGAPASTGFAGFGSSAPSAGFGSAAPFGATSSTAAFGAPSTQGNTGGFGQPSAGQFGAPAQSGGFQSGGFGAPSAFPPPSAPGQMIPNNPDNPFGSGGNAGGFNVGSTGTGGTQSRSEGRRKVRVRRRN